MLWSVRALMKPALSVIDLIPNIHRTPALAALRKAAKDGRVGHFKLATDDRELAFYDAQVQLVSPLGAELLKALYMQGKLKLKKPMQAKLPALDAYIAELPAFRTAVAGLLAEEAEKRARLDAIMQAPELAHPDEITPFLIGKVMTAQKGHGYYGSLEIGGLSCHRSLGAPEAGSDEKMRAEPRVLCWWIDADGQRQGDSD